MPASPCRGGVPPRVLRGMGNCDNFMQTITLRPRRKQCASMGEISARAKTGRAIPGIGMFALACLLWLSPAVSLWALDTNDVALHWAKVELEGNRLTAQQRAGQITPEVFQQL